MDAEQVWLPIDPEVLEHALQHMNRVAIIETDDDVIPADPVSKHLMQNKLYCFERIGNAVGHLGGLANVEF